MANGFLPFPTFGGEKSPGIMSVKLPTVPVRFPTAQRTRRTPEPTTVEKLAPFAPYLLQGIGQFMRGDEDPTVLSQEDFITEMGGDPEAPTKAQKAAYTAYQIYGDPDDTSLSFGEIIGNALIASQMDRGAGDYAKAFFDIKKAERDKSARKETARSGLIKSLTDANLQFKSFKNATAAELGLPDDIRTGYFDGDTGDSFIVSDDKSGYINILQHEGNWVPVADIETADPQENPDFKALRTLDEGINEKESALIGTITVANKTVDFMDEAIKDPSVNPATLVSTIGNLANSAASNIDQLGALFKDRGGTLADGFSNMRDVANGISGSYGRSGNGEEGKKLLLAIQSGDEKLIEQAMASFEANADLDTPFSFRDTLGDLAYANVRARGTMLQLAYMAAAANGQTGRTLSDKDLAYHLQMIGFGASQDPQVIRDNLIDFVDTIALSITNDAGAVFGPTRMRLYDLEADDFYGRVLSAYWNDGIGMTQLRSFQDRYKNLPEVKKWFDRPRRDKEQKEDQITISPDQKFPLDEEALRLLSTQ
tara:strand:- start:3689 stop:5302 length:1614 start_codon:yes stop_codon:yes gene_type:complete